MKFKGTLDVRIAVDVSCNIYFINIDGKSQYGCHLICGCDGHGYFTGIAAVGGWFIFQITIGAAAAFNSVFRRYIQNIGHGCLIICKIQKITAVIILFDGFLGRKGFGISFCGHFKDGIIGVQRFIDIGNVILKGGGFKGDRVSSGTVTILIGHGSIVWYKAIHQCL